MASWLSLTSSLSFQEGEFDWDKSTQGLVLGAFFWGYMVTQVPGGYLAAKFGGKHIFGWFMLVCAVATLFMPLAARTSYIFLIILRIVAGLGQGVVWPAMHAMWSHWAPPLERSTLIGFTFAGNSECKAVTSFKSLHVTECLTWEAFVFF